MKLVKQVFIDVVDNGFVVSWVDDMDDSHKEIVNTKVNLKDKLLELFA